MGLKHGTYVISQEAHVSEQPRQPRGNPLKKRMQRSAFPRDGYFGMLFCVQCDQRSLEEASDQD